MTPSTGTRASAGELASIVDLDRYPLNELDGSSGRELVERCRTELVEVGACELRRFLRPEAVARAVEDAVALKPLAHRSVIAHTIDLQPATIAGDDEDPLVSGLRTAKATLAYDRVPTGSVLRTLYESDLVTRFIARALEVE